MKRSSIAEPFDKLRTGKDIHLFMGNLSLRLIGVVESKKALERRIKHMLNKSVPKSSKCETFGLITVILTGAILFPMDYNPVVRASNTQRNSRENSEANAIVPGLRAGDYTFGMSKDDVLKRRSTTRISESGF